MITSTSVAQVNSVNGRYYEAQGKRYPSVTRIIAATRNEVECDRLRNWAKKMDKIHVGGGAKLISENARLRGKEIHAFAEAFLLGMNVSVPDELLPYWQPLRPILGAIHDVVAIECPVYHDCGDGLGWAGTLDLVASFSGTASVFDIKTSERLKKFQWLHEARLQICAYQWALESQYGLKIESGTVLCVSPNRVQMFEFNPVELRAEWLDRVKQYFEVKETA